MSNISKYSLHDLIDIDKITNLLKSFSTITGMVTAILDLNGNILSKIGWREICSNFHRKNTQTNLNCKESDTILASHLAKGSKYNVYKCLNGLIDIAIPIIIEGEHFGNLFTGQFLFEKPDTDFFRKQAHKFGFDEVSYLKALAKVPIIDEKDVKQYTDFLQDLTELLGEMGLNRIHDIEKKNDLQKSEKQLATLMSNLPGMVYRRKNDPHWTMEFISDGCQLLTGYRAEDLTGNALTSYSEIIHPKDRNMVRDTIQTALKDKKSFKSTYRIITSTGEEKCVWEQGLGVFGDNEEIVAIEGFITDITERKRSKEALKTQEHFIAAIADTSPALIYVYDMKTSSNVYVNSGMERLLGYSAKEIHEMGENVFTLLIHPDDLDKVIAFQSKILTVKDHDVLEVEYRMKHNNGSWVVLHSFERVFLRNADGSVKQKIGAAIDITDRKKAEIEILENARILRNSQRIAKIGSWNWNFITDKAEWSNEIIEMYGRNVKDGSPNNEEWKKLIHQDDWERFNSHVNEVKAGDCEYNIEYRIKRADTGELRYIHSLGEVVYENGIPTRLIGVDQDITKRKKAEEELKKKMHDLEIFNDAAVGRELMINELRKEINELLAKLGKEPKYKIIT